jgi:cholinesterase
LALSGGLADSNALYFVWGGANDFLTFDSATSAAQHIALYVSELAAAGAEHFLVPNLPDLNLTPFVKSGSGSGGAYDPDFSESFNNELAIQLGNLSSLLPSIDIVQFDTFSFFNRIIANPVGYGFTNIANACLSGLVVCSTPDSYIYWDDFHPTTQLHALFAKEFAIAVPEPGTLILLALGLFALSLSGSLRRKFNRSQVRLHS